MSAHPIRPQGVVLHHSSHRSIAALTACVLAALGNGASAPYLTVSVPEPMRLEPPPPVPAPFTHPEVKSTPAEEKAHIMALFPAIPTLPGPVLAAPANAPPPPQSPPTPKFELVPDTIQPKPTRLEEILPYFVPPPAPPVSRATYEEK